MKPDTRFQSDLKRTIRRACWLENIYRFWFAVMAIALLIGIVGGYAAVVNNVAAIWYIGYPILFFLATGIISAICSGRFLAASSYTLANWTLDRCKEIWVRSLTDSNARSFVITTKDGHAEHFEWCPPPNYYRVMHQTVKFRFPQLEL